MVPLVSCTHLFARYLVVQDMSSYWINVESSSTTCVTSLSPANFIHGLRRHD